MRHGITWVVVACGAGFLAGIASSRMEQGARAYQAPATSHSATLPKNGKIHPVRGAGKDPVVSAPSADTLDSFLELDDFHGSYARLADWLLIANEQEIAALWQHYRQLETRNNDLDDLIFIHWTRLDPHAAVAAAKGTPNEQYAWWAWARHDPRKALQTALAESPGCVANVTWGIGEFHPDWLMAHFDELPEEGRQNALMGFTKRAGGKDLPAAIDFLKRNHMGSGSFHGALARQNPNAACRMIEDSEDHNFESLLDSIAKENPAMLDQIDRTKLEPDDVRKLELKIMERLFREAPEEALTKAETLGDKTLMVHALANSGCDVVSGNPDEAFALARRMFGTDGDALLNTPTDYDPQRHGNRGDNETACAFIHQLLVRDPERVMAMVSTERRDNFERLCKTWAGWDVGGLADWANRQADPETRQLAARSISYQLLAEERFEEAATWDRTSNNSDLLWSTHRKWRQTDPAAAEAWLDASGLSETQKADLMRKGEGEER